MRHKFKSSIWTPKLKGFSKKGSLLRKRVEMGSMTSVEPEGLLLNDLTGTAKGE
jgi:hypothetical protein